MNYKIKRPISIFLISLFAANLATPLLAANVPGGTTVQLRLNQTLTGSNSVVGSFVDLTVVSDVFSPDGALVIKSGATAEGQVTTAKKSGMLGQPGSVGISVTSVTAVDGTRIPVQAVSAADGENKTAISVILGLLCILGFFMKGGDGELISGMIITARTLSNVEVSS